jgi:hypothetical protein
MAWSITSAQPNERTDAALLVAGKCLYIANAFEYKCRWVLRILNLGQYFKENPTGDFDAAIASLARDKLLHPTIKALSAFPVVKQSDVDTLDRARDARNFIAHEGASMGEWFQRIGVDVDDHLDKLRKALADVSDGDNVVSRWVYQIEEKEAAPRSMVEGYAAIVDKWVFGSTKTD